MAARAETLMGLSGLGDLVLTCSSAQSRNFAFGQRLGQGVRRRRGRRRQARRGRCHRAARSSTLARAQASRCRSPQAVDRGASPGAIGPSTRRSMR